MMRLTFLLLTLALLVSFPFSSAAQAEDWRGFRFDLESLDGDDLSEDDVFEDGTLYLVDFWASWCRPCSQLLGHLEDMAEDYEEDGFQVVIFCIDEAGLISTARATISIEDYPFTVLFDPELEIKNELGVRNPPTSILFDAAGEELWRHTGYEAGEEDEIREAIEDNLPRDDEEEDEVDEEVVEEEDSGEEETTESSTEEG